MGLFVSGQRSIEVRSMPRRSSERRPRRLTCSRRIAGVLLVAWLAASGCSPAPHTNLVDWVHNGFKVGPNYCPPSAPVSSGWIDAGDGRVHVDPAQDCAWWTVFNDSTLNSLVETAYRQNLDLRAAGAGSCRAAHSGISPSAISFRRRRPPRLTTCMHRSARTWGCRSPARSTSGPTASICRGRSISGASIAVRSKRPRPT